MLRAIALDDEPPALKIIESFCQEIDYLSLQKTFTRPSEAQKYLENFPVDILFLDINMPSITGVEFYRKLLNNEPSQELMLIFTTAYSEYAVEGFNLNALDYLLKPFTFERFGEAIAKAKERFDLLQKRQQSQDDYLFIRADYTLHKIALKDIVFIEGLDDYLKIHTTNARPLVARMTMKVILTKLPEKSFVRVHRSFIVPFSRIDSVRAKVIQVGQEEIPIGASYEADFWHRYNTK